MRVTGNRLIDMSATTTAANQTRVAEAAAEASSGLHVTKPSDDPAAWMAAQRANAHKKLLAGTTSALQSGMDRLDLVDQSLASIGDAVAQVRTLAVQGTTASYSAQDRIGLGAQVRALFDSAVASANTRTSDGEYLFAGSKSLTLPFDAAGTYRGDATARDASVAGSALTSANGVDVLPLLARVATALEGNDVPALRTTLDELATAIKQVATSRSHVGGMMNSVDASLTAAQDLDAHLTNEVSRNVESDVVSAATELAKASQALEASRAVTSHIVALTDPRAGG
jgi:flagellar hook-associated protein 3 FlgL